MFDVGGGELIIIVLAILLLFGPKSLPQFARQMGKGLRQFRKAQEDLTQQIRDISADAAVREALDMTPTTVVRPPTGGVPVSRSLIDTPADLDTPDASLSAGQPSTEASPDDTTDASTSTPGAPTDTNPTT